MKLEEAKQKAKDLSLKTDDLITILEEGKDEYSVLERETTEEEDKKVYGVYANGEDLLG